MTSRALLFGTAFALAVGSAALAQPAKREVGNIVYDGAPATPPALQAAIAPYYNARSAVFEDWLPDGSMLIATRFGDTNQIHRVAKPGAARTQLTFFNEPISVAQVRPGTSTYLYPRDVGGAEYYQAYLRDLSGRETQVTAPNTRNQAFVFSKDGKTVAWSQVTPGDPNYDIVLANPTNPTGRRTVLEGTGSMAPLDITADGKTILATRSISQTFNELFVLDVASGKLTPIGPARKIGYQGGAFVNGGAGVLTLSDDGAEHTRPVVIDVKSGAVRDLEPGAKWSSEDFDLSPDGKTVALSVNEEGYSTLVLRDVATGKVLPGPKLPQGVLTAAKFSPDGSRIGLSLSTSTSSGDVWSYDLKSGQLTRWTESELGGLDPAKLVEPTLFRYPTFDGKQIPAFIYKPKAGPNAKNGGGKLPVVIQIHGGPEGQEQPSFNPRRQSWVNELGAAVIIPNVRGSSGYGKTYLGLDNAEKREDSVKDIGALLDWVAKQPDLDASKVAVVGQSYGGYMVLAVAGHYNDRVAGIIDLYGISDWVTFLQNTEGYRRDNRRAEYGDERDPKMKAVFDKIAPIKMSDRMKKPMMVFQGANDPRVPRTESEQMVAKLRAQGTEVWYVLAKDEGHGIYKKANQEAVRATEVVFLKKVLGVE
jgi:dipeptidyl aminopeptidase/acylaminoacyl peptidase